MALNPVSRPGKRCAILAVVFILATLLFSISPVLQAADSDSGEVKDLSAETDIGEALGSVNGVLIDRAEFERNFSRVLTHSRAATASALALDVLHSMIDQELIVQYAEAKAINISDAHVDAEIDSLRRGIVDTGWEEWLEQNGYTETELRRAVFLQLTNNTVRNRVTSYLNGLVEHVHARHILVSSAAQARYVKARLDAGIEFIALAAVSLDVTTRERGGDLGWFARGELLDNRLTEAAFALKNGAIAGPIATRLGYHIVQSLGNEMRPVSAERKARIAANVFNLWMEAQFEAAEIVLNLDLLDEIGR